MVEFTPDDTPILTAFLKAEGWNFGDFSADLNNDEWVIWHYTEETLRYYSRSREIEEYRTESEDEMVAFLRSIRK